MPALALAAALIAPAQLHAQEDPAALLKQRPPSSFQRTRGDLVGPIRKIDQAQPLYLQGDELIYDSRGNKVTARGNVEIFFNNYILTADEVVYDQGANTLTAVGNVTVKEPNGTIIRADRYTLTDDFRDGFVSALSVVTRDDTRIQAERAERREGNVTEFSNGKFTPCKSEPGSPPLWCIGAAKIIHDQRAATISYQDAWFEILGQPLIYLPYFQHPDPSVKRKSGFLLPDWGSSNDLGFTFELPYYFALAPNYDFTFHPMYTSRQGVLWQGDWRHRVAFGGITGQYDIKFAAIDDGQNRIRANLKDEDWSGSVQSRGRFSLASWWSFGWDVTLESDDTFRRFYKLDNLLQTDRVNVVYLTGQSERNYLSLKGYHFGGLLLRDNPNSESRAHPIFDWNYVLGQPVPVIGGELSWNVNALSFSRSEGALNKRTTSDINRVVADVSWRRTLTDRIGITYTPFANLRGDAYQYADVIDPLSGQAITEDTVTRGVASAGLLAAYPWVAHTANASHVVEPIGQIIGRTAKVDQRRLPVEDARSLVFDDANLFELDKFSGYDRIETGTRANVGVQYTFQSGYGPYMRLLAGQSFHLSGDNAFADVGKVRPNDPTSQFVFNPRSGLETDRSDYVLGAYLAPSSFFRFIGQGRFDERDWTLRRTDLYGQVNYGPILAQAQYAFTAADHTIGQKTDQQDIYGLLGLKITDRVSLLGMLRYDLDEGRRLQDQIQLRYADECFVLTATYTENFITDTSRDLTEDRSVMLRFELKHLGEFRYKTDVLDHFFAENQSPQQ